MTGRGVTVGTTRTALSIKQVHLSQFPENAKLTADRIVSRESVLDPGPLTGVKNTGPRWDFFGHSLSARSESLRVRC